MANGTRTITVKFDGSAKGLVAAAGEVAAVLGRTGNQTFLKKAQADADALSAKLKQTAKDAEGSGSLMGGALALGLSAAAPVVSAALIGGVALGFVGMAVLAQKNNAKVKASFGDLKDQVVGEMQGASDQVVPYLVKAGNSLQQEFANLGPQLHTAFGFAGPDVAILTSGVDNLASNAMPGLVNTMRNSKPVVQGIATVLGDLGTTATTVLDDVSAHSQQFGNDLAQVGTLIKNVGSITGAVLPGLASGFGTTVGTVNTLLTVLKPVAPALGDIAGEALPAVGAFKLFGLATKPLNNLGSKIAGAASKVGGYTQSLTGSEKVASKVVTTTSKVGKAFGSLGNVLPAVGVGFALLGDVVSAADQKQQQLLQDLVAGGAAGRKATADIAASAPTIAHLAAGFQQGEGNARQFTDALSVATKGMDPLQRATAIYNADLDRFGANSKITAGAQRNLAAASDNNANSQRNLALAAQDVNTKLNAQTTALLGDVSAGLGFQSSILGVTQAQQAYAASLKSTGAKSLATKQASIAYQQALLQEVNAAGAAAVAHDRNGTASDKAKVQQQAETATILGLAAAAGKNAPPALKQLEQGLTDSQIAAFNATGKIAGTKQAVITLPNGKKITINVDSDGVAVAKQTQQALDRLRSKVVTLTVLEQIKTFPGSLLPGTGGRISHRAMGGPAMAGMPYVVGDGGGPEIFVPRQSGDIIGTRESADILSGRGGGGPAVGGDTITLEFAGEVLAQIIDGRLRSYNRDLVRAVKAGSAIR